MLRDALRLIRRARDLSDLFALLGYSRDDTPLDHGWTIVARWRSFRVVAGEHSDAREAARSHARRLAASARPTLVVVLDPTRALALAGPYTGRPSGSRLLVIALDNPSRFALRQLAALAPDGAPNALALALRITDLLASEQVGERFFTAWRALQQRMAASLRPHGSSADREMAALLALTRVLFLYFVQEKGWLDGRTDYLRELLDTTLARRRHFHRTVLHPLFFGTLNRPPRERAPDPALGNVPYLNGGLFEPHPVERRIGPAVFPNALWRDAFDGLFDRFRFCVREGDEVDAIAPDMLGRVFERVMSDDERHATGTFYTPESVVRQIVDATIATALADDGPLSADLAERVVRGEPVPAPAAKAARHALRRLRLLDPAVGSGAFLLSALESLTLARLALQSRVGAATRWKMRRRVLKENLFGVDLSPVAVRLAELRLWLAIVADDPTRDPARVEPLPNLDAVVRQGNSLLDPIGAARSLGIRLPHMRPETRAVHRARAALFDARGRVRRVRERELRRAEEALAHATVASADEYTRAALRDLATAARGRDLFGARAGMTEPQQRRYRALRRQLAALRAARRRIGDGEIPFFAFEVHCPEVTARAGFTVVVGNPPWVRAERLPPALRATLKERFAWWRSGPGRGFGHLPDLSVAFLERSLELTAPGGAVGLLVPSKLATAGYAARARETLVRETALTYLHRVPDREAARFRATIYPLALITKRTRPQRGHRVHLDFERQRSSSQRGLTGTGPWILLPDRARRALTRLLETGIPLAVASAPALGIKTGADAVFVGAVVRRGHGTSVVRFGSDDVEIENTVLRRAIRGRDIDPFFVRPQRVLLWCYDAEGRPLMHLPPLARSYLSRHRTRLIARADYRTGPTWTLFRTAAAQAPWRVVWADIARHPMSVVVEETTARDALPLNSCYVAASRDRETVLVMSACLNSTWARVIVRATSDEARGGYRRNNARVIGRIPIPQPGRARKALAAVSARAHQHHDVDQDELDDAVARALSLSRAIRAELGALADDQR